MREAVPPARTQAPLSGERPHAVVNRAAQCHRRAVRRGTCSCRDVFTQTAGPWRQEEGNSSCHEA